MLWRHRVKQLMDTPKKASSPEEIAARLAEAAKRANEEADARRAAEKPLHLPPEQGGPKGRNPPAMAIGREKA